jgi:hypothetical protein
MDTPHFRLLMSLQEEINSSGLMLALTGVRSLAEDGIILQFSSGVNDFVYIECLFGKSLKSTHRCVLPQAVGGSDGANGVVLRPVHGRHPHAQSHPPAVKERGEDRQSGARVPAHGETPDKTFIAG